MGDSIRLGMGIMGEAKPPRRRILQTDRKTIAEGIQSRGLDPEVEQALIQKLNSYPDGALPNFVMNLPSILENIRMKIRKQ